MSKSVAIIAPQFLPCSYPPAHRVRFFTNHLEAFGWKPVVLCVEHAYMEEPADAEFCAMVPDALEILKVRALPARWTRMIGLGDLGIRCFPHMLRRVKELCRERRIDALFIPGPPWHTFLIGPRIKRQFGIPYVLDYIDPWVSSWGQGASLRSKAFWYRQVAKLLEPYAVRDADHIIAVSEGTNDGVHERFPHIPASRFTAIPYGGEPSDFDYLRAHLRPNPYWDESDGCRHIVYVGAMLPKAYETLRAVFGAVRKLRDDAPDVGARLRLHFFGTTYAPNPTKGLVMPVADEEGVGDVVTEHPRRVPYLDANNILCRADAILAMGTTETHYTASKIFPCLLARRPLLAIYHQASSVVDIVRDSTGQSVITYSDRERAASRTPDIAAWLHAFMSTEPAAPPLDLSRFAPYTAEAMTKRLAAVMDAVT